MKYICILILTAASTRIHAESPYAREFQQLKDQRDKAASAALDPINRRYQTSIEQLLRRATQGNDLDTALKIKGEMSAPTLTTPGAAQSHKNSLKDFTSAEEFGQWLIGTEWKKGDKDLFRFVAATTLEFEVLAPKKKLIYPYRILAIGEIEYTDQNIKLTIERNLKTMTHATYGSYDFIRPKPAKN